MAEKTKVLPTKEFDYIGMYNEAIEKVIEACGSKEAANRMLGEIEKLYERTAEELAKARDENKKVQILQGARAKIGDVIRKYAPGASEHTMEIILGASLAISALVIPTFGASLLAVISTLAAIGSSYYISFKILRNWGAIAGKARITSLVGLIPKLKKKK